MKFVQDRAIILKSSAWALVALLAACQSPPLPPPVSAPVATAPIYSGPVLPLAQSDRGVQIFLPSTVLFAVGEASFNEADAAPYLDRVAQLLTTKTNKTIVIEGNTDSTGSANGNQKLSLARAKAVEQALVARNVPTSRLSSVGYSSLRPIASNATEEGRKLNRRVEVLILDEKVETLTKGEPANAFASAWDQLKKLIESGAVKAVN